jgi:outer membrane protein assembly factor BamB
VWGFLYISRNSNKFTELQILKIMKKKNLVFCTVTILLIISAQAFSQDWPQFRGVGRDSKATGVVPSAWPSELTQQWKITVGTGDATPVLLGKKIYTFTRQGNEEVVLCLDAPTGKELWKYSYTAPAVTGPPASHPGPRSTPAVANGKIVSFGVSGIVSCLDAASGKLVWKKEEPTALIPQFYTGMSPIIVDGMCIVHVGGKDNGQVIAFDLNTGNEKWKYTGEGPAYASPSVMTAGKIKQIVLVTEKSLISLNLTNGKLLWQVTAIPMQRFYNCVSPYINGQTIYYTGQGSGTKAIQVVKKGNQFVSKELWSTAEIGAKWNTPVLKDGFLYGFTDQKRIYCLNASNGQTGWIDAATNSDFATIVDCGSVLIGLPMTGNLLVFKQDPKAYTEIARYKVAETPVYAFPVIAGNLIYIKDAESLTLYKIN